MKTLILYLSRDGQTQKIAENIAQHCQNEVVVQSLKLTPTAQQLTEFEQIIIGASIRYGHFDPLLEQFISQHYLLLNQKRTAFFSVNLTARKANRNTPATNTYTRKLLARIKWKPNLVEVFAGALYYPRYRWFDRLLIQFIMKITGGETDTRKEIEYTNWQQVQHFAHKINKI